MYKKLFTPIKIGSLELKNRIVMPAIHLMYNMEGYANDKFCEFYYRRAEGGAGLIMVGGCRFDDYGGSPGMMSLRSDDFIPGYKDFTDGMHSRGAKVGVQLYHAGAYAHQIANEGREALAPSAVFSKFTKEMPKEATRDELHEIIQNWAAGAVRAKKAGFDLVEISASAGYLICQFLSPLTNLRTDEYGGSWENRTRFPKELLSSVRAAVGADYPICVRIAGNDFVPGSNTLEDAVSFAKLLEQWGADMINVTGGWHETNIPQLTGDVPQGGFTYLAQAVKEAVGIPVAASNRISEPAVAEKLLAVGACDMVSIGRPLIADPDWAKKAQMGESRTIRRCLACNQGCLAKTFFAMPAECMINALAGHESEYKEVKTLAPKSILVIGGGVAGCEFAIRAAECGHKVSIWEKSDRLGGQLHLAAAAPAKHDFLNLYSYHREMIERLGIPVVYEKDADVEEICGSGFEVVVTAVGNTPKTISLEGNTIPVCTAYDIFSGEFIAGKNVVIIGGGAVGCECAQLLAHDAAVSPENIYFMLAQRSESADTVVSLIDKTSRNISIVDMAKIATGFEQGTAWPLLKDLDRFGVKQYPFAKILGFGDDSVQIEAVVPKTRQQKAKERETGITQPDIVIDATLPCDTIVLSVGAVPNSVLYDALKAKGMNVYNIGDSEHVGKISDAVCAAYELAQRI